MPRCHQLRGCYRSRLHKAFLFSIYLATEEGLWKGINTRVRMLNQQRILLLPSSTMLLHFRDCLDYMASMRLPVNIPDVHIPRFSSPFRQIIRSLSAQLFIFHFRHNPPQSNSVFIEFLIYLICLGNCECYLVH